MAVQVPLRDGADSWLAEELAIEGGDPLANLLLAASAVMWEGSVSMDVTTVTSGSGSQGNCDPTGYSWSPTLNDTSSRSKGLQGGANLCRRTPSNSVKNSGDGTWHGHLRLSVVMPVT